VRLNVDLDATLTVIANGCYRWLATQLRGFDKAAPKQLYRRFVETGGTVRIENDQIVVTFDRRSHNPILREATLDRERSNGGSPSMRCAYSGHSTHCFLRDRPSLP
jgi:hypothetical protein